MSYLYKESKKEINEILDSKTDIEECEKIPSHEQFSFNNGYRTWASSIFVDIVDSTKYYKNEKISENIRARIIRAFVEELVSILNDNENLYDIGIRGDCVFGIFKAEYKEKILTVFRTAYCINTFLKMFNQILSKRNLPLLKAGIGIGTGKDLIIKAGKKKVVNDKIWIGDALINASNLSKIANRDGFEPICMDETTYINIIDMLKKENPNYASWVQKVSSFKYNGVFYSCNIIQKDFNNWIDGGMKD